MNLRTFRFLPSHPIHHGTNSHRNMLAMVIHEAVLRNEIVDTACRCKQAYATPIYIVPKAVTAPNSAAAMFP